jgi:hypothetical protein
MVLVTRIKLDGAMATDIMVTEELDTVNHITANRVFVFRFIDIEVQCNYYETHIMNIFTITVSPFPEHMHLRDIFIRLLV